MIRPIVNHTRKDIEPNIFICSSIKKKKNKRLPLVNDRMAVIRERTTNAYGAIIRAINTLIRSHLI